MSISHPGPITGENTGSLGGPTRNLEQREGRQVQPPPTVQEIGLQTKIGRGKAKPPVKLAEKHGPPAQKPVSPHHVSPEIALSNNEDNFVGGKVQQFALLWEQITSDRWVLDNIRNGISVELVDGLHGSSTRQILFSSTELKLLEVELEKLLLKGVVKEVEPASDQYLSTIFRRQKRDGLQRVILNLKYLNQSVEKVHFKLDSLKSADTHEARLLLWVTGY